MDTCIIHANAAHADLLDRLARAAASTAEILITGPSGVGKELYAAFAHEKSPRRNRPFAAVNCANLSPEMIENEIFGHAKGAFTGAVAATSGIAAAADGGTLFLDEVDTLPLATQAKLLRFVQLREYRRLGESALRRADLRLIASSNADLLTRVKEGSFRDDLYFRLRVMPFDIPALKDRPDDIAPLIDHFTKKYADEYACEPVAFTGPARRALMAYPWPGNVRELENCIRCLTCLRLGRPAEPADLPLIDLGETAPEPPPDIPPLEDVPMQEAKAAVVEGFERMYIDNALREADGNVAQAARKSGKHRRAFFELMRRYGFCAADYRG
jgi:DNA-binding NtrC family response regulator